MIHRWAPAEHLAALRIAVFGIWLCHIATTPYLQYPRLPGELVEPHGLMRLVPVESLLSSPTALVALKTAALAACAAGVLGLRPWRPVAIVAVLLVLGHDGAMKSIQGYVNHGQVAALYAAMVLAASPAADAWSAHRRRATARSEWRYGGPLMACALLLATAYTLIGARRLVWGGVEVFTDGSVVRWVVARTLQHAAYDFEVGLLVLDLPLAGALLPLGMLIVTLFEASSLLALRHDGLRRAWLAVIVPFHVATMFLMNILFWENLILLAVLFVRLPLPGAPAGSPDRSRGVRSGGGRVPADARH